MIKNALAYVSRKKNRTLIVLVILTLVLSCLYACLSIMKSSNNLEKTLYKTSNSSLSITKKASGYFAMNQFKDIHKIKEIQEIVPQYNGTAKLTNAKVVEGEQKIKREDVPNQFKNLVSVEAINNIKKNVLFGSGVFTIKQGRGIDKNDRNKIMVHEDFAKKNKLKLHDKISLELTKIDNSGTHPAHQFEIVGIFSGKKQEKYTGLSSDFSENSMFVDYQSSQTALGLKESEQVVNKLNLFASSPEHLDESLKKVKQLAIDWANYDLAKDDNAFKEAIESLGGVKYIINIMTYAIMAGGVIVLSLILMLWLRERVYEIGILLSIGFSKAQIVGQFLLELLLISLPATIASLLFGSLLLSQIVSGFASADETGTLANNLLSSDGNVNWLLTFIQSYGVLISIIVISVVLSSAMILIKKPKKILSQIS